MTPTKIKKNGPELFFCADLLAEVEDVEAVVPVADFAVDAEEEVGIVVGETTPRVGTSGMVTVEVDPRDALFFTALLVDFFTGRFETDFLAAFLTTFLVGRFATAFFTARFAGLDAEDFATVFFAAFLATFLAGLLAAFLAVRFAATSMTPCQVTLRETSSFSSLTRRYSVTSKSSFNRALNLRES